MNREDAKCAKKIYGREESLRELKTLRGLHFFAVKQ
jgi:hypothetical protein